MFVKSVMLETVRLIRIRTRQLRPNLTWITRTSSLPIKTCTISWSRNMRSSMGAKRSFLTSMRLWSTLRSLKPIQLTSCFQSILRVVNARSMFKCARAAASSYKKSESTTRSSSSLQVYRSMRSLWWTFWIRNELLRSASSESTAPILMGNMWRIWRASAAPWKTSLS